MVKDSLNSGGGITWNTRAVKVDDFYHCSFLTFKQMMFNLLSNTDSCCSVVCLLCYRKNILFQSILAFLAFFKERKREREREREREGGDDGVDDGAGDRVRQR